MSKISAPTPFQAKAMAVPERINLALLGGRGGGKTTAATLLALRHCVQYEDKARILIIRSTYKSLANFWDEAVALVTEKKTITVQAALEHYLAVSASTSQHRAYVTRALTVRLHDWLDLPLKAITGRLVRERHAALTPQGPVMADETMRAFRTVWNLARVEVESEALPDCPTGQLERAHKTTNQQWNNLTPGRNKAIHDLSGWRAAVDRIMNPVHREFYLFTLLTGCRRTEVATIRWEQINREDRFLHLPTTKSGRAHYLPLNDHHFAILDRLPVQGAFAFPDKTNSGPVVHPRHDEVPGTLHSLRHTFGTVAAEIGVPKDQVGRLLNHSHGMASVTDRYISVHVNSLRPFMDDVTTELVKRQAV